MDWAFLGQNKQNLWICRFWSTRVKKEQLPSVTHAGYYSLEIPGIKFRGAVKVGLGSPAEGRGRGALSAERLLLAPARPGWTLFRLGRGLSDDGFNRFNPDLPYLSPATFTSHRTQKKILALNEKEVLSFRTQLLIINFIIYFYLYFHLIARTVT